MKRIHTDVNGSAAPAKRARGVVTEKKCSSATCKSAGVPQPVENFSKKKDGLQSMCKGCDPPTLLILVY